MSVNRKIIRANNAKLKKKKPREMTDEELSAIYQSSLIASKVVSLIGSIISEVIIDFTFNLEMEIANRKLRGVNNELSGLQEQSQGDDGVPDHPEISLQGQTDAVPDE